ncbi:type II toxin-antitoxin system RelE/ParE family toxin [Mannheimia haemolytica]|uniref:type II toxin-antitoxin system RelE/ParE family toxin n=1 Tax=Mannheimia haemolytica TaxID=75985 RepID=UPI001EFF0E54|nr:type II toxin-antitoxin system RelE/ParE family toxin [Mannheimia haemolytica]
MNNPYHNVSQEYLDYLAKKVKQGKEDIKNGRIYSPEEVRKELLLPLLEVLKMPKKLHNIYYTEEALIDLENIAISVSEFTGYASSGIRILEELENSINNLAIFPTMGVKGAIINTRELYHNGYRIVCEVKENEISIITIVHCSRLYP